MNITRENIDNLNAVLKIEIEKSDYEDRVKKILADYRKKAVIKGFRPGKVPAGMINKMYGKPVLVDEVNKLLSESVANYIKDENLNILGEPLPSENDQKHIDWDSDDVFEFKIDVALVPEFELKLTNKDKIPYYEIKVDDKLIETYTDSYQRRFGQMIPADKLQEKEMFKASLQQLDAVGNIDEEGITHDEGVLSLDRIQDDTIKKELTGAKVGDVINLNIKKALQNDTEISSLLHIKKEEVEELSPEFQLIIKEITKFEKAIVNQELFDKVYGEGNVKSEEEFYTRIKEEIKTNLAQESDYKFRMDAKNELIKKHEFELPTEFLKRWLLASNEGKVSKEDLEKDFGGFEEDLKWQLIKNKISKENELKVSEEEIKDFAREVARGQYRQYGLSDVPDEHLDNFVTEILSRDEERRKIVERKHEDKVVDHVKETVKLDKKEISSEKFKKLVEENK